MQYIRILLVCVLKSIHSFIKLQRFIDKRTLEHAWHVKQLKYIDKIDAHSYAIFAIKNIKINNKHNNTFPWCIVNCLRKYHSSVELLSKVTSDYCRKELLLLNTRLIFSLVGTRALGMPKLMKDSGSISNFMNEADLSRTALFIAASHMFLKISNHAPGVL